MSSSLDATTLPLTLIELTSRSCRQERVDLGGFFTRDRVVVVSLREASTIDTYHFAAVVHKRPAQTTVLDGRVMLDHQVDRRPFRLAIGFCFGDDGPGEGGFWV